MLLHAQIAHLIYGVLAACRAAAVEIYGQERQPNLINPPVLQGLPCSESHTPPQYQFLLQCRSGLSRCTGQPETILHHQQGHRIVL